jgi:hypothetical protein
MEHEPILLVGTDKMIPRYAFYKSFKIQLPDKNEWQNEFSPNKMEAWSGIWTGPKLL